MRWLIPGLLLLSTGCAPLEAPTDLAEGEGLVRLECIVLDDGRMTDCAVLSEQPVGQGFGEAALRAARQARLGADVVRGPRTKVQYSVRFRLDEPAALDLQPPRA